MNYTLIKVSLAMLGPCEISLFLSSQNFNILKGTVIMTTRANLNSISVFRFQVLLLLTDINCNSKTLPMCSVLFRKLLYVLVF